MTLEILLEMKKTLEDAANDEDISVIVISVGGEGFHLGAVVFGEVGNADWKLTPVEFREISQFAREIFRYIETHAKGKLRHGPVPAPYPHGGELENHY